MTCRLLSCAILAAACARSEPKSTANLQHARASAETTAKEVCATPPHGIIVSRDSVASFSTHSTLAALVKQCGAGKSDLYDAVGWQADAWTFPFVGARVMVVQTRHSNGALSEDEVPDLWTVEGDSVRLPDGELVPRTLGALRSHYGTIDVDDNINADDIDGPYAHSCRFPYLRFALTVLDTARHVPDSARVTRVDLALADSGHVRYCTTGGRPDAR
jgi:hypothetical protein